MTKTPITDSERIEWLSAEPSRLFDVYYRMQNEDEDVRAAIDWFIDCARPVR